MDKEQLTTIYNNGVKVLNTAINSEATLTKLGKGLYATLETTKKAAQELVNEKTSGNAVEKFESNIGIDFLYLEVMEIDRIEKELRKNALAKALLDGGFAAEDTAFEKKQTGKTSSSKVTIENQDEEIIQDF